MTGRVPLLQRHECQIGLTRVGHYYDPAVKQTCPDCKTALPPTGQSVQTSPLSQRS